MSGVVNRVQARIQQVEPRAQYVHCANHLLNLALQNATNESHLLRTAMEIAHEVAKMFAESAKRTDMLYSAAKELDVIPASVPMFCATRWVAREATLKGILVMYGPIMSCLEEIADGDSWRGQDVAVKAAGLLANMKKTTTYFGLLVARTVLGACEDLATALQSSSLLFPEVDSALVVLQAQLTKMEGKFMDELWKTAKKVETELSLQEPSPRRARQPTPKTQERGAVADSEMPVSERAVNDGKVAIQKVCKHIHARFTSDGFKFVTRANRVLLAAAKEEDVDTEDVKQIVIYLRDDLDIDKFTRHLHNLASIRSKDHPLNSKDLSVDEIIDAVVDLDAVARAMISEVEKFWSPSPHRQPPLKGASLP